MRQLLFAVLFCFNTTCAFAGELTWRAVWEWSMPKRTEADMIKIAESAHSLGFNVIMMSPRAELTEFMAEQCRQRNMKLYLSTVFFGGDQAFKQVMLPEEQERADSPPDEAYMRGGEPVLPGEVFNSWLPCYARPEVREYFAKRVADNAARPVDGLAFDGVGYQNYYRCYCEVCEEKLAQFRARHPHLSEQVASDICAEQTMIDFIDEMAAIARQTNPDIELTIHIWPWFAPNPNHGHRTDIDYVGQTVSWFFAPHWPLEKVQQMTREIVRDQHLVHPAHHAAPFLSFDARRPRDYRSAARMAREVQIVKESGARAIQFAELGYLLHKPLVAEAVARELGGDYRADWSN